MEQKKDIAIIEHIEAENYYQGADGAYFVCKKLVE